VISDQLVPESSVNSSRPSDMTQPCMRERRPIRDTLGNENRSTGVGPGLGVGVGLGLGVALGLGVELATGVRGSVVSVTVGVSVVGMGLAGGVGDGSGSVISPQAVIEMTMSVNLAFAPSLALLVI
jgi:hypothetical protein